MKQLQEMLKPYFSGGQKDYDITAVLKYISSNTENHNSMYNTYGGYIRVMPKYNYQEASKPRFPNKPLHLYTEQEDKALLDLLNKIK